VKENNMHSKAIYTALFLISILTSSFALSGPGHHHGMDQAPSPTEQQLITQATSDLNRIIETEMLIEGEKLDANWKGVVDKKVFKKTSWHFITSFTHPTNTKTLYILLNAQGSFVGANFTGNFEGI
jgi:hypothetical protein